jgi:hypothetical protein
MKIEYELGTQFKSLKEAQRYLDELYNRAEDLLPYYVCHLIKREKRVLH